MTRTAFDALVTRIEAATARSPWRLRPSLAFWALLGYAGFLSQLFIVWVIGVSLTYMGLVAEHNAGSWLVIIGICICILGSVTSIRHLWVSFGTPEGVEVTEKEAPALMAEISTLRKTLGAQRVFRVLLTPECNASVCEIPRLGIIGWPKNYLVLGLPLMDELTPDEFRAVLAHEFAHLSGRHGRFSGWIYRLRRTWGNVFENWENSSTGHSLARRLTTAFVNWWWPRFNARAFVLSRLCEYEADLAAARITAPEHITRGLLRIKLVNALMEGPVQKLLNQLAAESPIPLADYTTFLQKQRRLPSHQPDFARWCHEAFLIPTGHSDTHPSLTDRMKSITAKLGGPEIQKTPPFPAALSAAEHFLTTGLTSLRHSVEALWKKESTTSWETRHTSAADLRRRSVVADTHRQADSRDTSQLWEKATTLAALHGSAAAIPVVQQLLAVQPNHPEANIAMAQHLLDAGDATAGEGCLTKAMQGNAQAFAKAADILHQHFRRTGQTERLRSLDALLDNDEKSRADGDKERRTVTDADTFIAHTLRDEELITLRDLLGKTPGLKRADLAEKLLHHRPAQRLFVLSLHGRGNALGLGSTTAATAALQTLTPQVQLPGRLMILAAGGPMASVAKKIARLPNPTIWQL
jgi:Zn-dependent protease with chaperone function